MRYVVLQQIGGQAWLVYDMDYQQEIKFFTGPGGRDVAVELAMVLNKGSEALVKEAQATEEMQGMRTDVQPNSNRRRVLQRKVQGGGVPPKESKGA